MIRSVCLQLLFYLGVACIFTTSHGIAQTITQEEPEKQIQAQHTEKNSDKTDTINSQVKTTEIDWGDWNLSPDSQFGVGIQGAIEAEISQLDKSNLLHNASGVAISEKNSNTQLNSKQSSVDLKKMMAELEAMEAKVKKEIEDDTEF